MLRRALVAPAHLERLGRVLEEFARCARRWAQRLGEGAPWKRSGDQSLTTSATRGEATLPSHQRIECCVARSWHLRILSALEEFSRNLQDVQGGGRSALEKERLGKGRGTKVSRLRLREERQHCLAIKELNVA